MDQILGKEPGREEVFDRDGLSSHDREKSNRDTHAVTFGETVPTGIIWHDLRRTFATRLRANGVLRIRGPGDH